MTDGESCSTKTEFVAPTWTRRFGSPGELVAAVQREESAGLEHGLSSPLARRIRAGSPTVRDLILAALSMNASPVEMWPSTL